MTGWIQDRANALLADGLAEVERVPFERARRASTTHRFEVEFGECAYERIDAAATPEQKARLVRLSPEQITASGLADEPTPARLTTAPGNNAPIGG